MADPMTLFDHDDDQFHPNNLYDFDLLQSYDQKKNFIEKVFEEERILCHCFIGNEFERSHFVCFLHEVYRNKLQFMIQGLKGKMTFREFNTYFCSFF